MTDHKLKVDEVRFGKLRDDNIDITIEDDGVSIIAQLKGTNISVNADSRDSLRENWEIAQQALNSALEHQEATGTGQKPVEGHW